MRILASAILIPIAVLQAAFSVAAGAHEFETNHIERSVDVVIRDQKIEVKYSIGLADTTIVDWLVREQLIDATEEARFRKQILALEGTAETTKKKEATKQDSGDVVDGQSESTESNLKKPALDQSALSKTVGQTPATEKTPQPLQFQTELMELLREKLSESVTDSLELKCNGTALKYSEIAVSNSARHHVAMEILLKADLPNDDKMELSFVDQNFLETVTSASEEKVGSNVERTESPKFKYFGNIRRACRVKGRIVQLNSNVAPVLARAKLTDVESLDLEQRVAAATIATKIAIVRTEEP